MEILNEISKWGDEVRALVFVSSFKKELRTDSSLNLYVIPYSSVEKDVPCTDSFSTLTYGKLYLVRDVQYGILY